jgi:hypothetical protein
MEIKDYYDGKRFCNCNSIWTGTVCLYINPLSVGKCPKCNMHWWTFKSKKHYENWLLHKGNNVKPLIKIKKGGSGESKSTTLKTILKHAKECLDHAENKKGLGYSNTAKGCKMCVISYPNYAEKCKKLTKEKKIMKASGEVKEKSVAKTTKAVMLGTGKHKFRAGTARGVAYDLYSQGKADDVIISDLMDRFGYTKSFAKSKLQVVKKLATE